MPARAVTNRYGGTHIIGQFPSLKMGCMVPFESRLEMDCLYLLDYDPLVMAFEAQPLVITYPDDKRTRQYVPDVRVQLQPPLAPILLECKPTNRLEDPANQRKFAAAHIWCAAHGIQFAVVTDDLLREGVYYANVKRLAQFARHPVDCKFAENCITLLGQSPQKSLRLGELAARVSPNHPAQGLPRLYHLLYHHQLNADLEWAVLDENIPVTLPFQQQGEVHARQNLHGFRALLLA